MVSLLPTSLFIQQLTIWFFITFDWSQFDAIFSFNMIRTFSRVFYSPTILLPSIIGNRKKEPNSLKLHYLFVLKNYFKFFFIFYLFYFIILKFKLYFFQP